MKTYLLDTFEYNSATNLKLLGKIGLLEDPQPSIRLFSHLVNCQYKWLARVLHTPGYENMSWWEPVYDFQQLEPEWNKSTRAWITFLEGITDEALNLEVEFTGADGSRWAATPLDIALQLNYHSIHHRAQIQMLIRQQGIEPDFVDYIGTRYRRIG